jgi:hypothetical protein
MVRASSGGQGPLSKSFFVYILKCSNDTFYIGCTTNLKDRLFRHYFSISIFFTVTNSSACIRTKYLPLATSNPLSSAPFQTTA